MKRRRGYDTTFVQHSHSLASRLGFVTNNTFVHKRCLPNLGFLGANNVNVLKQVNTLEQYAVEVFRIRIRIINNVKRCLQDSIAEYSVE